MIDTIAAFVTYLLADAALAAEVEHRIKGAPPGLPSSVLDSSTALPVKALVVQGAPGRIDASSPQLYVTLYLTAYGQTGMEAQDVLRKVYAALYYTSGTLAGKVKSNIVIANRWFMYWAQMISTPAVRMEPQSNWPIAEATIQAKFDALRGA